MTIHTAEVYNSSIIYNKTKVLKYICTLNWQHKVKYYCTLYEFNKTNNRNWWNNAYWNHCSSTVKHNLILIASQMEINADMMFGQISKCCRLYTKLDKTGSDNKTTEEIHIHN